VAYWNLDEASGTRADSHTNGLDLTDNNTVTTGLGVDGVSTAAAFLKANTEYLSHADDALLDAGDIDFTFCGWVYADAGWDGLMGKGYNAEYSFLNGGIGLWQVRKGDDSGAVNTTAAVSTGAWHFLRFGHDMTRNVAFLRVDEGAESTGAITEGVRASTNAFTLGGEVGWGYLNGRMQGWGFWKRIVTDDEATWLMNSGTAARTYSAVAAYTG
jgi:hypothetical protein